MRKFFIFHPFGFAVFPLLLIFSNNAGEIPLRGLVIPLLIVVCFTGMSLLLLRMFIGNLDKRALVLSVFLLLLFSYGHAVRAARNIGFPDNTVLGPEAIVFILWSILLVILTYAALRTDRELRPWTRVLNVVAGILLGVQIIVGGNTLLSATATTTIPNLASPDRSTTAELPDIYYIIVDGYARADVLQRIYNYDNSEFLSFLRARGFYVAEQSTTNYCQTALSLASSLNFDYLQKLATFDKNSNDRALLLGILHNNCVFAFLRHLGYTIIAPASGYAYTEFVAADHYLTPGMTLSELDNSILSLTPVPFIMNLGKTQYDFHRDRQNYILNNMPSFKDGTPPRFIIAHLVLPHPPFVFGRDGEPITRTRLFNFSDGSHYYRDGGSPEEYLDGYRNQLAYLNRRLRKTIEDILTAGRTRPPIVIIQADHGPGSHLDWGLLTATDVTERMGILNAYYLPGLPQNPLYTAITPVNTFRVIFNEYFGTAYPLLPDRNYFSTINLLYDFSDVTDMVGMPPVSP